MVSMNWTSAQIPYKILITLLNAMEASAAFTICIIWYVPWTKAWKQKRLNFRFKFPGLLFRSILGQCEEKLNAANNDNNRKQKKPWKKL